MLQSMTAALVLMLARQVFSPLIISSCGIMACNLRSSQCVKAYKQKTASWNKEIFAGPIPHLHCHVGCKLNP